MIEFIAGFIIGVAALWLGIHEKQRHMIYEKKIQIYSSLQIYAADCLQAVLDINSKDEDDFIKAKNQIFQKLHENAFLINQSVMSDAYSIYLKDFQDAKRDKKNFYFIFDKLVETINEDLKITNIHGIFKIFSGPEPAKAKEIYEQHISKSKTSKGD